MKRFGYAIFAIWYAVALATVSFAQYYPTGGSGGTPGGSNGQLQYNNAGSFGGLTNAQLTTDVNVATDMLSGAIPALSNGKIVVGKTASAVQAVSPSGDVASISNAGVFTLKNTGPGASSATNASVTIDAQGRVTALSSGTGAQAIPKALLTNQSGGSGAGTATLNPSVAALNQAGNLTVEFWAQAQTVTGTQIFLSNTDGTGYYYQCYIDNSGVIHWVTRDSAGANGVTLSSAGLTFPTGVWCHVAATTSGTTANLYFNGALTATGTQAGTPGVSGTPIFRLGQNSGGNQFYGRIKNVAIYSSARTQAQIIADMAGTPGGSPTAYYPCTDAAGATTIVDTVAANNLTCTGGAAADGGVPATPPTP